VNRLLISAQLIERQALRYTPAGLPALDVLLKHESEVTQEGQVRKVQAEVRARAIGSAVQALAALPIGASADFAGFLGGSRNGRGLVFHILEQQTLPAAATTPPAAAQPD
jgi:primosomal replication protein N